MTPAILVRIPGAKVTDTFEYNGHTCVQFAFPNGFGLSVARGPMTYGGKSGLYEAVPFVQGGDFLHAELEGWLDDLGVLLMADKVAAR